MIFKIIYSIDKLSSYIYDDLYNLGFYKLVNICDENNVSEHEIDGMDSSDLTNLIMDRGFGLDELYNRINSDIPHTILDNPTIFELTEEDNNSDELGIGETTIHRKYCAELSILQFVNLINNYSGYTTCNTGGILTSNGLYPAFNVEGDNENAMEDLYVSCIFCSERSNEDMINIENSIRELIENSSLTIDSINNLLV